LRDEYDDLRGRGAEVVAIGTGDHEYAAAFVQDEGVPFPVLVDDHGEAARAASVPSVGLFSLIFNKDSRPGARRARQAGHRIRRPGKRVTQLGATFVVGPGERVRYQHIDVHSADHAPLDQIRAALA
jgi:hypothetical protein